MSKAEIVGVGVDTVKVNVKLLNEDKDLITVQEIPDWLHVMLQTWQDQAKEQGKPVRTTMTFHDARMMMYPNGASSWRFIVRNDCLELKIAPRLKLSMIAKVTFLSSYLWEVGDVSSAVEEVRIFLSDVFGHSLLLQAAQIDLCVDLTGLDFPTEWERVFLSLAKVKREIGDTHKDEIYYRGRTIETLLFSGHGRPVSCKIYDKVAEIKRHKEEKKWFYTLWEQRGWDKKTSVRRVEYSIERPGLHEMSLESIDETILNIKRIWAYCTQEWLRMVEPGRAKNRAKWKTHPTWELLQGAFDTYGNEVIDGLGPLVRQRKREASIEQAVAALGGYSTTYAAWEDITFDDELCAAQVFSLIYDKVLERWSKMGVSPVDIIREKKFLYSQKS